MSTQTGSKFARFIPAEIAARLPETATAMLADEYLVDRQNASCRVFRVYRGVPAHFHRQCDEYLYVLSGRGTFWMGDPSTEAEFSPGQLLFFEREIVHALPTLLEQPVVFLSIDAPRREPKDITFVDPQDGTAADFMARNAY
ncbi:cupin domain-containing protein [Rhizobium leguminosarum]|uniref:cupin domain-containing protein n=1 Tax=Rhizobium TaxID=379 RepID=UPI00102FD41E|nr:cupin domain-containing protein [Rhizobium leguminosarum]TBF87424.1 cupin domain-containing protein [Rhizobium leguminosarum]TBG07039.1 cupin domain-containing protein [Rhizobium leguminosarum]TBG07811.1 cupin domain-containing protein [Rhizobium leguminosarum]TBG30730.1 cupin domain-containing protein [Rhizobium leguminosarum]TBG50110.1 cupin domain-containing protein [Rhizobium leguminosarum]